MSNSFSSRTNSGLIQAVHTLVNVAEEAPASFGLTSAEITDLKGTATLLGDAVQEQAARRASLDEAIANKDVARGAILASLARAARSVYADAALTDSQIRSLGLAPRAGGGVRPLAILAPGDLVAAGFADATVKLSWSRNGNPQGTTFQIEGSADGFEFEIVDTTTRASILLSGYAPGVAAWFRVTAKRAGLASPPSNVSPVYAPSAPARPALKVA